MIILSRFQWVKTGICRTFHTDDVFVTGITAHVLHPIRVFVILNAAFGSPINRVLIPPSSPAKYLKKFGRKGIQTCDISNRNLMQKRNSSDLVMKLRPVCNNSSSPGIAYMRRWTGSALVQIMACRLSGTKPLPEPMLTYCWLDHMEQNSVKLESKYKTFHSRKCIWKGRLRNGGHFAQGRWVKPSK